MKRTLLFLFSLLMVAISSQAAQMDISNLTVTAVNGSSTSVTSDLDHLETITVKFSLGDISGMNFSWVMFNASGNVTVSVGGKSYTGTVSKVAPYNDPSWTFTFSPAITDAGAYSLEIPANVISNGSNSNAAYTQANFFSIAGGGSSEPAIDYFEGAYISVPENGSVYSSKATVNGMTVEAVFPKAKEDGKAVTLNSTAKPVAVGPNGQIEGSYTPAFGGRIGFSSALTPGQYTLTIPAGAYTIEGVASPELKSTFTVKDATLLNTFTATPKDEFNLSYILLDFPNLGNNYIAAKEGVEAKLTGNGQTYTTTNLGTRFTEGKVGTITFSEDIMAPGEYTLTVPEGAFTLEDCTDIKSAGKTFAFTIAKVLEPVTVESLDPDGGEVESLQDFNIVLTGENEEFGFGSDKKLIVLTNAAGQTVANGSLRNYNDFSIVRLDKEVTEAGNYTLTFQPGAFFSYDEDMQPLPETENEQTYTYNYTILAKANPFENPSIEPAEGEYYDLQKFVITFPEIGDYNIAYGLGDAVMTLPNGEKELQKIGRENLDKAAAVNFSEAFTTPGKYTLTIPAGTIWTREDETIKNTEELVYTYTIKANPWKAEVRNIGSNNGEFTFTLYFSNSNAGMFPNYSLNDNMKVTLKAEGLIPVENTAAELNMGNLNLTFPVLEPGTYTVNVPAGMVSMGSDKAPAFELKDAIVIAPKPAVNPFTKGDETVVPANNSEMVVNDFNNIVITYNLEEGQTIAVSDQTIEIKGAQTRTGKVAVEGGKVTITPDVAITEAGKYTVTIPAGKFYVAGNTELANEAMTLTYTLTAPVFVPEYTLTAIDVNGTQVATNNVEGVKTINAQINNDGNSVVWNAEVVKTVKVTNAEDAEVPCEVTTTPNTLVLNFDPAITAEGAYSIEFPAEICTIMGKVAEAVSMKDAFTVKAPDLGIYKNYTVSPEGEVYSFDEVRISFPQVERIWVDNAAGITVTRDGENIPVRSQGGASLILYPLDENDKTTTISEPGEYLVTIAPASISNVKNVSNGLIQATFTVVAEPITANYEVGLYTTGDELTYKKEVEAIEAISLTVNGLQTLTEKMTWNTELLNKVVLTNGTDSFAPATAEVNQAGNSIKMIFSETIAAEGTYSLELPKGLFTFKGNKVAADYIENVAVVVNKPDPFKNPSIEPAEGEYYDLQKFVITFPEIGDYNIAYGLGDAVMTLPNGEKELQKIGRENLDKAAAVNFSEAFTTPGKYTLTIPAGTIWTREDETIKNTKELVYTYTIKANPWTVTMDQLNGQSATTIEEGNLKELRLAFSINNSQDFNYGLDATKKVEIKNVENGTVYNGTPSVLNQGMRFVTVTFDKAIAAGTYDIIIPAGMMTFYNGTPNPEMTIEKAFTVTEKPAVNPFTLDDETVDPAEGNVEALNKIVITYPSATAIVATDVKATLTGVFNRESKITAEGNTVSVEFSDIDNAGDYTVTIPAGAFHVEGNTELANPEIVLHYTLVKASVDADYTFTANEKDGAVESVTVNVSYNKNVASWNTEKFAEIVVTNAKGNTPAFTVDGAGNTLMLTFTPALTEAATYSVTLPEGLCAFSGAPSVEKTYADAFAVKGVDYGQFTGYNFELAENNSVIRVNFPALTEQLYDNKDEVKQPLLINGEPASLKNWMVSDYKTLVFNLTEPLTAGTYNLTVAAKAVDTYSYEYNPELTGVVTVEAEALAANYEFTLYTTGDEISNEKELEVVEAIAIKAAGIEQTITDRIEWNTELVDQIYVTNGTDNFAVASSDIRNDGSVKVTFAGPVNAEGTYSVVLPAGLFSFKGQEVEAAIVADVFTIVAPAPDYFGEWILEPADGAEVEQIDCVSVTFPNCEGNAMEGRDMWATLKNVTTGTEYKYAWSESENYVDYMGGIIYFNDGEPITEPGVYELNIVKGAWYIWGEGIESPEINATFTIVAPAVDIFADYTIDPENGSVLESFEKFTITLPNIGDHYVQTLDPDAPKPYMQDAAGNKIEGLLGSDGDKNMIVRFDSERFTVDGEYTLVIPEGAAFDYDNAAVKSPEMTFTYTLDMRNGVEAILGEGVENFTILDIAGRVIVKNGDKSDVRNLQNGLYIINGKKINIRK